MKMSIRVHIMWCLKDRLSEIEMRFYAIFTARKGNYSVISRVKLNKNLLKQSQIHTVVHLV